jgi:hypothetical protein
MGPMTVEMLDIDSQDRLEVASAEDEHPVEALTLERADEPIGDCVGLGALIGVRTIRSPSERKISSATTVFGTVVRLGDTDKAGMAKVQVKGPFRGGRGTRTHKPFRATVFKL